MKPDEYRADSQRPFNSKEYLASLRDGREIYIYGQRVKDVTTHPAFRNAAASIGTLYDALHDPASHPRLCWQTDTGNGGYTHKFFRFARSPEEMRQRPRRSLPRLSLYVILTKKVFPSGMIFSPFTSTFCGVLNWLSGNSGSSARCSIR